MAYKVKEQNKTNVVYFGTEVIDLSKATQEELKRLHDIGHEFVIKVEDGKK